jgi:hypothetical protein
VGNAVPNPMPNSELTTCPALTILWAVRRAVEGPIAACGELGSGMGDALVSSPFRLSCLGGDRGVRVTRSVSMSRYSVLGERVGDQIEELPWCSEASGSAKRQVAPSAVEAPSAAMTRTRLGDERGAGSDASAGFRARRL